MELGEGDNLRSYGAGGVTGAVLCRTSQVTRESAWAGERGEGGRERESQAGSTPSMEPDTGLHPTNGIMTGAEIKSWTLIRLSHSSTPDSGLLTAMATHQRALPFKITLAALWTLNIWNSLRSSSFLPSTLFSQSLFI